MHQLALLSEEDAKKGRSRSGNAAVKLVLVAHKSDLINLGTMAASGASYAAAVSGSATEKNSSSQSQSQAKGEIAVNRVRSILERELTKRANDLRNSVSIEGLGSDQPSSSSGDQGVIDASSGLTGLECVGGSGGGKEGFKFANWEYGEVDFVSSWVEVSRQEFDDEDTSGDTSAEEKGIGARDEDGEDGLAEVKGWLNHNLA